MFAAGGEFFLSIPQKLVVAHAAMSTVLVKANILAQNMGSKMRRPTSGPYGNGFNSGPTPISVLQLERLVESS